jgi:hypothetical protein
VLRATHLSGSNGVDCDLNGADHISDFKTLEGLSHYDSTSTTPKGTLEEEQNSLNSEHHDLIRSSTSSCLARSKTREAL